MAVARLVGLVLLAAGSLVLVVLGLCWFPFFSRAPSRGPAFLQVSPPVFWDFGSLHQRPPVPCVVMDRGPERAVAHFVMNAVAGARRTPGRQETGGAPPKSPATILLSLLPSLFWDFGSLFQWRFMLLGRLSFSYRSLPRREFSASFTLLRSRYSLSLSLSRLFHLSFAVPCGFIPEALY